MYSALSQFNIHLFFAVCGPLTVAASPVVEHRLQTRRLSGHGSRAQLLRGTWDLPGPGHEPVSPASAGGLSTTTPPGKPQEVRLICIQQFSPIREGLKAGEFNKSTSFLLNSLRALMAFFFEEGPVESIVRTWGAIRWLRVLESLESWASSWGFNWSAMGSLRGGSEVGK